MFAWHGGADEWQRIPGEDDKRDHQFEFENSKSLVFVVFLFHLLFLINEDRETVSSSPLQAAEIEEVAYVKKIIVTKGTHIYIVLIVVE